MPTSRRIDDGREQGRVGPQPVVHQQHQDRRAVPRRRPLSRSARRRAARSATAASRASAGPAVRRPRAGTVSQPWARWGSHRHHSRVAPGPTAPPATSTSAGLCRVATCATTQAARCARGRARRPRSPAARAARSTSTGTSATAEPRSRSPARPSASGDDRLGLSSRERRRARRRVAVPSRSVQEVRVPGLPLPQPRRQASAASRRPRRGRGGAGAATRAQSAVVAATRSRVGGALLLVRAAVLAHSSWRARRSSTWFHATMTGVNRENRAISQRRVTTTSSSPMTRGISIAPEGKPPRRPARAAGSGSAPRPTAPGARRVAAG